MRIAPVVGEMSPREVGDSSAILHAVDVSHGDEVEMDLSFERVKL